MQRGVDEFPRLISPTSGAVVEPPNPHGATLTWVCCTVSLWNSLGLGLNSETSVFGLAATEQFHADLCGL